MCFSISFETTVKDVAHKGFLEEVGQCFERKFH